ncbi:MAG: hypothetical protein V5A27_08975, partial [Halapricum sp.]
MFDVAPDSPEFDEETVANRLPVGASHSLNVFHPPVGVQMDAWSRHENHTQGDGQTEEADAGDWRVVAGSLASTPLEHARPG